MSRSETAGAARFRAERAALAVAQARQALAAAEAELRAAGGDPVAAVGTPAAPGVDNSKNPMMMQVMRDVPTDSAKYFTEGGMADVHQPAGRPSSVSVVRDHSLPTPSQGPRTDANGYFSDLPMSGPGR